VKKTAWLAVCLMTLGQSTLVVDAAQRSAANRGSGTVVRAGADAPEVVGTVQYDTGVNVGFHPDAGQRTVGNRFNSNFGGPLLMTGMVTMATFFPQNGGGPQTLSFFGPPNGTTAMILMFFAVNGLVAGQFNVVTLATPVTVGPDFLGMFIGFYGGTPSGLLGMDDMTNPGQVGFHALSGIYTAGGTLTNITVVPNRNAMFRSRGDILVPVELMDFKLQQ
jgi:hypothetical protein